MPFGFCAPGRVGAEQVGEDDSDDHHPDQVIPGTGIADEKTEPGFKKKDRENQSPADRSQYSGKISETNRNQNNNEQKDERGCAAERRLAKNRSQSSRRHCAASGTNRSRNPARHIGTTPVAMEHDPSVNDSENCEKVVRSSFETWVCNGFPLSLRHSAIKRLSANGHCALTHCASERKPACDATCETSSSEYL